MSTCVISSFVRSIFPSLIIGVLSAFMWGPLSGVGRDKDPDNNWNLRKKRYGSAFAAWFRLFLTFALIAYVIFIVALALKCYY